MLVPRPRRLAELVAQLGGVGVLGLPADQARPVGEQRLVDDLHAPRRCLVAFADLVRGEQSGIDQLTKHLLGRFVGRIAKYGQKLVPLAGGAGSFGGDEVSEDLADNGQPVAADAVDGRFRVVCQGAGDTADVEVGLTGEQFSLAIALLPQPRHSKCEQRQRPALAGHRVQHLVRQCIVFERVAVLCRRLDDGSAKILGGGHLDRGEPGEDR